MNSIVAAMIINTNQEAKTVLPMNKNKKTQNDGIIVSKDRSVIFRKAFWE